MIFACKGHQRFAGFRLNIGRIDNRQFARREPLASDKPEHLEGVGCGALIVFVVADQASTVIR